MWEFLTGSKMQRLVVIASIFAILSTVDLGWDDSRWWCIIVLLLVLEFLAHSAGIKTGIECILDTHKLKLLQIKELYDSSSNGVELTVTDLDEILKKKDKNDTE